MRKRVLVILLTSVIGAFSLVGCGQNEDGAKPEESKQQETYDELEGITLSVIGDSYFGGKGLDDTSKVWPALLASKYHMEFNNYGMNGSTISNYAGSNFNPMVDRWEEIAHNNPDIIIVEGGRNDYNKNVPMGELGTTDKGTMKGAVAYLLSSLKEQFPNALIIGITCWEVGGLPNDQGYTCSEYGQAFIEVCEKMGVPYIDAMDSETIGVHMTDANFRRQYCINHDDISHLNEEGMKLVLPAFEKQIGEKYQEFLKK